MTAMQEKIEVLHRNHTWKLVELPADRKAIGNKWVYKIKRDSNDQVERYRVRLVVKGYAQKEGVDFNEIFFSVVRLTIRVVLAILYPSSEAERMKTSRVPYASAVGSLMYAMICTRPDIAQAVAVVSRFMADPSKEYRNVVKRILRYIKGTSNVALCFGGSEFIVNGYVDSNFAGDIDKRKSTTSYMFTLAGGAVSWLSKLQIVVALSTTKAEYWQLHKHARKLFGFKD
ncbi:secreted RxLR effector protein 161-like [Arachis hypogaea]|uniref:secreted RxLR effector protein 161-like n=1 Tax=Arachis hypogaea TaxID=3818 RepID=UPI003B214612